jgi:uncharacterized protein (TIGR00251 family)
MILTVKVKPNSRVNGISKENDQVTIRIHAPAQDGKANKAVVEFLAEVFDVPRSCVEIVGGMTSQHKRIVIAEEYRSRVESFVSKL